METYIKAKIAYCKERGEQYANKHGMENHEQWRYWLGALRAWEEMLEMIRNFAPPQASTIQQ